MQKVKRVFISILFAYPVLMVIFAIMPKAIADLPVWARSLFIVCLMVPAIQLLIAPFVNKYFGNWINK